MKVGGQLERESIYCGVSVAFEVPLELVQWERGTEGDAATNTIRRPNI